MVASEGKRFSFIDILKGIAIALVVFGHFHPKGVSYPGYEFLNHMVYAFHMPLFMCASGFLFAFSREIKSFGDYGKLLRDKTRRLLIPYFSISIIILAVKLIAQQFIRLENPVTPDFLWSLFFCPWRGSATFLSFIYILFIIFAVFPLLKKYIRSAALLFSLILGLFFINCSMYFSLGVVFRYLIYFYLGVLLFKHKNRIIKKSGLWLPGLFFILLVMLFWAGSGFSGDTAGVILLKKVFELSMAVSGIMLCVFISLNIDEMSLPGRIFKILGIFSAPIYLLHTILMAPLRFALNDFMRLNAVTFTITAIITVGAGVLLPILITRYFIVRSKNISLFLLGVEPRVFQIPEAARRANG